MAWDSFKSAFISWKGGCCLTLFHTLYLFVLSPLLQVYGVDEPKRKEFFQNGFPVNIHRQSAGRCQQGEGGRLQFAYRTNKREVRKNTYRENLGTLRSNQTITYLNLGGMYCVSTATRPFLQPAEL